MVFIKKGKLFKMDTIDQTIKLLYSSICFEKGELPNVDGLRKLFMGDGMLINNNGEQPLVFSVDTFISAFETQIQSGAVWQLNEMEIQGVTEEFGKIAHRFSTYALFLNDQREPVSNGINSIQLIKDNGFWKVSCMTWNDQTTSLPIPEKYVSTL